MGTFRVSQKNVLLERVPATLIGIDDPLAKSGQDLSNAVVYGVLDSKVENAAQLFERNIVVAQIGIRRSVDDFGPGNGVANSEREVQHLNVARVGSDVEDLAGKLGAITRQGNFERSRRVAHVDEGPPLAPSAVDGDSTLNVGIFRHHVDGEVEAHARAQAEDGGQAQAGNVHRGAGFSPQVE